MPAHGRGRGSASLDGSPTSIMPHPRDDAQMYTPARPSSQCRECTRPLPQLEAAVVANCGQSWPPAAAASWPWCPQPAAPVPCRTPCMRGWAQAPPCATPAACCLTPAARGRGGRARAGRLALVPGLRAQARLRPRRPQVPSTTAHLLVQEAGLAGGGGARQQLQRFDHNHPRHDGVGSGDGMNDVARHALRRLRCTAGAAAHGCKGSVPRDAWHVHRIAAQRGARGDRAHTHAGTLVSNRDCMGMP